MAINSVTPLVFSTLNAIPLGNVCVLMMAYIFFSVFLAELTNKVDLQAHSGKTLLVTSGPSPPGAVPTTDTLLCPYVNLLLCNAQPAGEKH